MTEPTIVTLGDADACSLAAAERIVEILDVTIDSRGEAHWATTGGSATNSTCSPSRRRSVADWRSGIPRAAWCR